MKLILTAAVLMVAMAIHASGQDSRFAAFQFEIDPMLVPSTDTPAPGVAGTATIYLNEITLTNTTASDVTCSILDRQGTPRVLYSDTLFAKGSGKPSHYVMDYKGRKMPNGITWSCSAANAVVGYLQYSTGRY
jgi:hypothetical protein